MPSFCKTHLQFYRYGGCPACIEASVLAQNYATVAQINGRFGQLMANPDSINQDQFGVCGMTSAVYLLLRHNFALAQQLHQATFADVVGPFAGSRFPTAQHQQVRIRFRYLTRRYRLMEEENAAAVAAAAGRADPLPPMTNTFFVDYCLSRALGYVLKETAQARYEGEKAQFNSEFDPQHLGDYRNFTRPGNLALRTHNLAFIMKELLGAQHVHIASKAGHVPVVPLAPPVAGVTTSNFANTAELNPEFQNRLALRNSFALAAIYADIVDDGHRNSASGGNPNNPNLSYNHWIVINSFHRTAAGAVGGCPNAHADIGIWTWARNWNVQICENQVLSYIQDVIFGHF